MKKEYLFRDLYRRRPDLTLDLALSIFMLKDTSISRACLRAVCNRSHKDLLNLAIDPKDYDDVEDFKYDYLCLNLLSKSKSLDLDVDREYVALEKFAKSEVDCLDTNIRILLNVGRPFVGLSATSYLFTARRKIAKVLGSFDWNLAYPRFAFGPGASTRLSRLRSDSYYKFRGLPHTTSNCSDLSQCTILYTTLWSNYLRDNFDNNLLEVVEGNRVTTVPKDSKTDRVIAIEPDMNIYIQKGIGSLIRSRLRSVGVNLNSQEYNQQLARIGSIDDSLATIDLSSASDSVSLELCRELLPTDWYEAICTCRSEKGVFPDGRVFTYQKVSSMGNGFTFELESLIFWAISQSVLDLHEVMDRRLAVYGDDIIISTSAVDPLIKILSFCGFTVNSKKSFVSGPFRESCGKHYFRGVDVTPIYLRDKIDSYPRLIWFLNSVRRYSRIGSWGLDPFLKFTYDWGKSHINGFWGKPRIPDGYGDGALTGDFDQCTPSRAPSGLEGFISTSFSERCLSFLPNDMPILLKSLYQLSQRIDPADSSYLSVLRRSMKKKYKVTKTLYPLWSNLGPWLD